MVEKPRNDAQIKVEHVAEFVGKQGAMRDDLIEVEPTNINGLMARVDQCLELVQLVCCLFPRSSVSAVPLGWQSVKQKVLLAAQFQHCLQVAGMVSIVMRKL